MSGERIGCTCSARRLEDHYYYCPLAMLPDAEVEAIKARVKAAVEDGAARERSYVSAAIAQDPAALAANALAETEPYLASGIRTCRVCECRMADVCFGCNRENYDLGGIHAALEQPERLCDDLFFAGRALAREVERLIHTNDGEPASLRAALKLYREHDPDVLRDYSDADLIAMAEKNNA